MGFGTDWLLRIVPQKKKKKNYNRTFINNFQSYESI